jgi:hypothetical protein
MKTPSPPKKIISLEKRPYNTSVKKSNLPKFELIKQQEPKVDVNLTKKLIC